MTETKPTSPVEDSRPRSKHSPLVRLSLNLLRKVNRAVNEFGLIAEGDRVLAAVSGGKDSLSLLHLLTMQERFFPTKFEIGAIHVVSDYNTHTAETKDYCAEIFRSYGVPFDFTDITVTVDEQGNECAPSCFLCAWKRREALFRYCVEHGFNRLAFGHHFDDVAETTLMNLAFHGTLETMLPRRAFFDGKFDVIRPLFFLRERETARLAKMAGFRTEVCSCPNADTGMRLYMKDLVRGLARESKFLHFNIWRAAKEWHDAFADRPLHKGEVL